MKRKRINPRRRPATQADVKRAKEEGQERAIRLAWAIMFTVLADKEGYGTEDLQRVWGYVDDLSDSIAQGYCTVKDLSEILEIEVGARLT